MKFDILCVFGRGIEKIDGEWGATQPIEQLSEKNWHSGVHVEGIHMNDDNPQVVIAGAELNVMAAGHFYNRYAIEDIAPSVVVFAAGRPAYIADDPDPDLTEGRILKERFLEIVQLRPSTEVLIQGSNRNTRDDLLETLSLARKRGLHGIGIISVLVHIPRCQEFFKKALEVEPEFADYGVHFLASEMILMQEMPRFATWLPELLISKAYCRTAERERRGIADLRAGKYDFGSQGYSFAPTSTQ